MISLKHILNEQLQTPVVDHMPAIAAKGIYNSKGYVWDDEKGATKLIKQNIKDITQYIAVTKELRKLTGGKGLGQYLHSFMNFAQLYPIASYLINIIPEAHWAWTIKQVFTYADVIEKLSYDMPGAKGLIPSSSKRLSEKETLTMFFNKWKRELEAGKKPDLIYRMLTSPKLYGTQATNVLGDLQSFNTHEGMTNLAILTSFLGPVGMWVSSGIMLADAGIYVSEDNPTGAALSAVFASLPFISKIPAVQRFKSAALAKLGQKVSRFKSVAKSGSVKSITANELSTCTPDEIELIRIFQKHETYLLQASEGKYKIWKSILKDPKLTAYKKSITPAEWENVHASIFNGTRNYEDIKKLADAYFKTTGLSVGVGVKLTPSDLAGIKSLINTLKADSASGKLTASESVYYIDNIDIAAKPTSGVYRSIQGKDAAGNATKQVITKPIYTGAKTEKYNVPVYLLDDAAYAAKGGLASGGFVRDGAIYIPASKYVPTDNWKALSGVFQHEMAHLKDVGMKRSPKLAATYNPRAGQPWSSVPYMDPKQNWFKNYFFHAREVIANNTAIMAQIAGNVDDLVKWGGKARTIKILDDTLTLLKTTKTKNWLGHANWTNDINRIILGADHRMWITREQFVQLMDKDPVKLKELCTQLIIHIEKVKVDVAKMKGPGIKESIIKLKNLL
jgi:hypothetical protein